MDFIHKSLELIITAKDRIYMVIVNKIVFMIFPCNEDGVEIDGVEAKALNIVQVLKNSYKLSTQLTHAFLPLV